VLGLAAAAAYDDLAVGVLCIEENLLTGGPDVNLCRI